MFYFSLCQNNTVKPGARFLALVMAVLLFCSTSAFAQNTDTLLHKKVDSIRGSLQVSGGVHVTNNGISPVPSLTLGKPAAFFDLGVHGRRLSFEPQFRFALDGRPWSFIFWWRYKLVQGKKFRVNLSAHPALLFTHTTVYKDGEKLVITNAKRMGAFELVPTWRFGRKAEAGWYYLQGGSLDRGGNTRIKMAAIRGSYTASLPSGFRLRTVPMLFYLNLNGHEGYYVNGTLSLERKNWPVSISSILNAELKSKVPGSKPFIWNIGAAYAFSR